jgi:hypothetical protein
MHFIELVRPGAWVKHESAEAAHEIYMLLIAMEEQIAGAAIALSMFEAASASVDEYSEERDRIRREVEAALRAELGDRFYENHRESMVELDIRSVRKMLENGVPPGAYQFKLRFIHAHSFVYSLDMFGKLLAVLAGQPGVSDVLLPVLAEFNDKTPYLDKVRNSAAHLEDRLRGFLKMGHEKKGVRFQGPLTISNLENNALTYTVDDGTVQRIPITPETLNTMAAAMNRVYQSLVWEGDRELVHR